MQVIQGVTGIWWGVMGCVQSSALIARRRRDGVTDVNCRRRPVKRPVPQHEFLSDHEKELVLDTWQQLADDPVAIGTDVFLRIFQLAPDARRAFPSFVSQSDSQLVDSVLFRSHATRFVRAVDFVMSNLDALDVIVVANLVRLGRHHAATVPEFHCDYLAMFERAMTDVWAERLGGRYFDANTRCAWSKIFRLITSNVSDGYNEYNATASTTVAMSGTNERRV